MYQERISRVLAAMERMGLEQMLVSDPDSIWYLTGYDVFPFERLYAFYLRKDGQHKLFLNKLFPVPEAPYEQVWFSDTDDYLAILANAVDGEKDMGVDKDWPARFLLPLMAHNPSCKYVLASDCVDDARACKDAVERDLMREASRINDVVMERAAAYMKEGMTEREVADYIVAQYAAEGCDSTAFLPIVSYGAHAADPHHEADQTRLKAGDCIVIDMGCRKNRYCSDMTRTFFCRAADPKYAAIHDLVPTSWRSPCCGPACPCATWTRPHGTTSPPPDTENTSPTGWATSSARRSMRRATSAPPTPPWPSRV